MDSIDEKLQLFIEMYQKDRKRFEEEAVIKTPTQRIESAGDTPSLYEHPLNSIKDIGEESLADITGISSPDSEVINLPTNSLSRSSTITSMSQGIESFAITDIVKQTNTVFKETNAFNV